MINRLLHALHLVGFGALPTMILDDQNEWHSGGCCPKTWFCKCTMKTFAYWMFYSKDLGSEWYFWDFFFSPLIMDFEQLPQFLSQSWLLTVLPQGRKYSKKKSRYYPWMCLNTTLWLLFQSCVKNVYLQTVFLIICEKGWLRWKNTGGGYEV